MITSHSGLKIVDLAYTYLKTPVFSGIGFELLPGEVLQILGENGQGKTTLLRMLAGLLELQQGKIFWKGHEIEQLFEIYQRDLLYLGHQLALKPYLTARENLYLAARLRGYEVETHQLTAILDQLGLKENQDQLTYQLSAGQRQRLAIARLLAAPAQLWILDEPFSVLSRSGQDLMSDLIARHIESGGIVIFTSHHGVDLGKISLRVLTL